jgi:PAS domain S-box-containing protein
MASLASLIARSAAADLSARVERVLAGLSRPVGADDRSLRQLLEGLLARQDVLQDQVMGLQEALAERDAELQPLREAAATTPVGTAIDARCAEVLAGRRDEFAELLLFRHHPHPLFLVDTQNWRFLDGNDAAIEQYGWARDELQVMKLAAIHSEPEARRLARYLETSGVHLPKRSGVWQHRRRDGSLLYVHITSRPIRHGERAARLVSAVDISGWLETASARESALAALSRSEANLHVAQNIARVGSFELDVQSGVMRCSPQLLALLGRVGGGDSGGELTLAAFCRGIEARDAEAFRLACGVDSAAAARLDLRHQGAEGSLRWLSCSTEPVTTGRSGQVVSVIGTLQDITERIELESRLRELSALREVEIDRERKRIAGNLHDALGQLLSSVKLQVDMLWARAGAESPLQPGFQRISEMVEDTIDMTRSFSMHLRPPALDLGLVPALQWLADEFALRSEIDCRLQADAPFEPMPEDMTNDLFRIVQESLTNITRHADAREVRIALEVDHDRLLLSVRDDGRGFDLPQARSKGHYGLFGMNERALRLGGELRIDSTPGAGTRLTLSVPRCGPTATGQNRAP